MRSEYSITSVDSGVAAASFVLLSSPLVKGVKFNDLLRALAELLGKGKHGSVYKVVLDNGVGIAVKRTKDWGISSAEFTSRVRKIDKVKHPRRVRKIDKVKHPRVRSGEIGADLADQVTRRVSLRV
ncbi:Probable inactive receptor kinase At2g26730 [Linum grandiflorum]